MKNNGKNRFWIEVTCPSSVEGNEWLEMLIMINAILKVADNGRFSNVSADLCENEND